jgi:hypothetical protein
VEVVEVDKLVLELVVQEVVVKVQEELLTVLQPQVQLTQVVEEEVEMIQMHQVLFQIQVKTVVVV